MDRIGHDGAVEWDNVVETTAARLITNWVALCVPLVLCTFLVLIALIKYLRLRTRDEGTADMRQISEAVQDGTKGFWRVYYVTLSLFILPMGIVLLIVYLFIPNTVLDQSHLKTHTVWVTPAALSAFMVAFPLFFCFVFGALLSMLCSFLGMFLCNQANIRVASAARRNYYEAIDVGMGAGTIYGIFVRDVFLVRYWLFFVVVVVISSKSSSFLSPFCPTPL